MPVSITQASSAPGIRVTVLIQLNVSKETACQSDSPVLTWQSLILPIGLGRQ